MHTREKSLREEKPRTNSKNPSFSSTLLDEIYRSIDKTEVENQGQKKTEKNGKKYSNEVGEKTKNQVEDEEMANLRRACLIEKWMEKKVEEKNFIRRPPLIPEFEKDSLQDNDPLFFSSTSISSVSSSGVLSSPDTEYFASIEKTKKSCFGSSFPKPIKTKVSVSSQKNPPPPQPETEDSMKSRLEALKIYANLKNLKQPISPGARLTSFINSLFTNGSSKKSKSGKSGTCKHFVYTGSEEKSGHLKDERKSMSTKTSACSSTTSFSRLRLSKMGSKATLSKEVDLGKMKNIWKSEGVKMDDLKVYHQNHKKDDFGVEKRSICEDDKGGDTASDCSSELFEIDHLVLFGKKRFSEELPVYETTDLGKNLAIARGLMR